MHIDEVRDYVVRIEVHFLDLDKGRKFAIEAYYWLKEAIKQPTSWVSDFTEKTVMIADMCIKRDDLDG